jgi:hypothetical protein
MLKLALALMTAAFTSAATAAPVEPVELYECRYDGVDAHGDHLTEVGHVVTSDVNGGFETRTLGIPLFAAPSAQIYVWNQGGDIGKQLYVELYDNQDNTRRDGKLVAVGTPEVTVHLTASGVAATLTCKQL